MQAAVRYHAKLTIEYVANLVCQYTIWVFFKILRDDRFYPVNHHSFFASGYFFIDWYY